MARRCIGASVLVLLVAPACSLDASKLRPCPSEPTVTELCVVQSDGGSAVERLSATNMADPTKDVTPDAEDPSVLLAQVDVDTARIVTLAVGPSDGVVLIEINVYPSIDDLDDSAKPITSVECDRTKCTDWAMIQTRNGRAIDIPADQLRDEIVIIVSAFVDRVDESGAVSWGLLINES